MAITFNNLYTQATTYGSLAKEWASKNVTPKNAKKVGIVALKTLMYTVTQTLKDAKWAAKNFRKAPTDALKKITPIACVAIGLFFGGFTGQATVVYGVGAALIRGYQAQKTDLKEKTVE